VGAHQHSGVGTFVPRFLGFCLCLTTGNVNQGVGVYSSVTHARFLDREGDPHSPMIYGNQSGCLFKGAELYVMI